MDSPFIGMVQYFAFDFAPKGYALCNGALLAISQNQALFSLLGTTYGGNGVSTFALPDLRGRVARGMGTNFSIGEITGTANVTILTNNLPPHTHNASVKIGINTGNAGVGDPTAAVPAKPIAGRGAGTSANLYATTAEASKFLGNPSVTVGATGSTVPVNVQNPYLAVTACIAISGIFPSRN